MRQFIFCGVLLVTCGLTLAAQYDFPVVVHGLSLSLDTDGQRTVRPSDWIVAQVGDCRPDSLRISRTVFPRLATPPPGAADSLVFTCQDSNSESVEIWWKGADNEWLVTDSYALITGFDVCDCEPADCLPSRPTPLLLNGLSTSYGADGTRTVRARNFLATTESGLAYSFGPDPADSLRTYECAAGSVVAVDVYAHTTNGESGFAVTYLALAEGGCAGLAGPPALVIQGLSVPVGPAGVVSIPARAYAAPFAPDQQLAYSLAATDTLRSIGCAQVGGASQPLSLFNHASGTTGPAAISYLIGDDGRRFCSAPTPPAPLNDDWAAAQTIPPECETFYQFGPATVEEGEMLPGPGSGGTVWFILPESELDMNPMVRLRTPDSLFYAVYPGEGNEALSQGLLLPGADTVLGVCPPIGQGVVTWFLQLQQTAPGKISRCYFASPTESACFTRANDSLPVDLRPTVYPNPSEGLFYVRYPDAANWQDVQLYDARGQLLQRLPAGPEIDLTDHSPGLYLLRMRRTDGRESVQRVLKL